MQNSHHRRSFSRLATPKKACLAGIVAAGKRRKSVDEDVRSQPTRDFGTKYLGAGQWPVPTLHTVNTLKHSLQSTYSQWVQSCSRAEGLERQLLTTREQQKREQERAEQLLIQYEETKEALSEALQVCQVLSAQLRSPQLRNTSKVT